MANSDNKAFDMMTAAADKTAVDLFPVEFEKSTKSVHNALMAAGMTPAYGNIADLTDATLYALEGEFGNAAWSAAAAIPIIGQMVAGKRALKIAKESGEEMITLYRGVDKWHPKRKYKYRWEGRAMYEEIIDTGSSMVKKGKFVGGGGKIGGKNYPVGEMGIWVTKDKKFAEIFAGERFGKSEIMRYKNVRGQGSILAENPHILEFEVPKSYFKKFGKIKSKSDESVWGNYHFTEGLPKEFLKKVHK